MSKLIAIDIGHGSDTFERTGGKGLYVNGKKYEEHDFNSKVAVELDELLRANGFETVMKQKPFSPEVYLTARTNYYNAKVVDLVWSIHANANSKDEVEGRCAFYWNTSEDAKRLAELYADECHKVEFETHGNGLHACRLGSWTNFHICRETNMTAVLSENGFMTNDEPGINDDFELIFGSKQAAYVKDIARVHAKAIARFFNVNFEDKKTEPAPPTKIESVTVSSSQKGQRVESLYKGDEGLNFYAKPSWNNPVATFGYGMGWTIRKKLKVDGAAMYEVENSKGDVYYITATEKYVKVVTKAKPEPTPSYVGKRLEIGRAHV